jgi:hypothetical protein
MVHFGFGFPWVGFRDFYFTEGKGRVGDGRHTSNLRVRVAEDGGEEGEGVVMRSNRRTQSLPCQREGKGRREEIRRWGEVARWQHWEREKEQEGDGRQRQAEILSEEGNGIGREMEWNEMGWGENDVAAVASAVERNDRS